jgi:hypothetical protein
MERKWKKKYPIEIALEKNINKIGSALTWAIRTTVGFWFVIPKNKGDREFKKMVIFGLFLIMVGWIMVTIGTRHLFGL